MKITSFHADDIENTVAAMAPAELDRLPFGVIQLDETGKVLIYNAMEGKIAQRDPKVEIGKNFFTEVAPCTNVVGFRNRFDDGVKSGKLNAVFEFQFVGQGMPLVQIHMKSATEPKKYWIFVKRL